MSVGRHCLYMLFTLLRLFGKTLEKEDSRTESLHATIGQQRDAGKTKIQVSHECDDLRYSQWCQTQMIRQGELFCTCNETQSQNDLHSYSFLDVADS